MASQLIRPHCVEVKIHPFTREKKKQLEIDTACQLSQVKMHVEIVIGLVRQVFDIAINSFY